MLGPYAARLLRDDWNELGIDALREEVYSLLTNTGELKHVGNTTIFGNANKFDGEYRTLKWGVVVSQGFGEENSSYLDVIPAAGRKGGGAAVTERVYLPGMGLIGGVETRPVDFTVGSLVGYQNDINGLPIVQVGNGDTPVFRVAVANDKMKSGSAATPRGPYSCTIYLSTDGITWTDTGEVVAVYNPWNYRVLPGERIKVFKDPTSEIYLFWDTCTGDRTDTPDGDDASAPLPVDPPCTCGRETPGNLSVSPLSTTPCVTTPTPTVSTYYQVTDGGGADVFVTNAPVCMKVRFSGVRNACCDECDDTFNLQDDCYMYFVHRSAFDTDPSWVYTEGHTGDPIEERCYDQWYLVKTKDLPAGLHEPELNSDAEATCQFCLSMFEEIEAGYGSGSWPDDNNIVMYPSPAWSKFCDDYYGDKTITPGQEQRHNDGNQIMFVIQIGHGESAAGGDTQAVYYYTEPLGGDFSFPRTSPTPFDMSTITEMTFKARCATGYFGASNPNSPPNLDSSAEYVAIGYGNFWDVNSGTGGCWDQATGAPHPLGNNYNCIHMDNAGSINSGDEGYTSRDGTWQLQCLDGEPHGNEPMEDMGHTCATATATWEV